MRNFIHSIHLVFATAAFVHGAFNFFSGLTGAFLDAAYQFVFFAFDELQVVIGELCKFLFQLALGNVPVSFGGEHAHIIFVFAFFVSATRLGAARFLFARGVPTNRRNNFFRKTKHLTSAKTSGEKITLKGFANCKPTPFVGLQIALFDHVSASVQLMQMPLLRRNSQLNCFGTMPAKRKASGERFLEKVIRRS
jgi:hypothetical protein